MGNYMYKENEEEPRPTILPRNHNKQLQCLIDLNQNFIASNYHPYFTNFHQKVVKRDLVCCLSSLQQSNKSFAISDQYPNDKDEKLIYVAIKQDLKDKVKHPYNLLLQHYQAFIQELFDIKQQDQSNTYLSADIRLSTELSKKSQLPVRKSRTEPDTDCLNPQIDINCRSKNHILIQQFSHLSIEHLGKLILDQLSLFFQIFHKILEYVYGKAIIQIYSAEIDKLTDRELMIQRIYQKDLLDTESPLSQILCCSLFNVYSQKSTLLGEEIFSPHVLHPSLLPQSRKYSQFSEQSPSLEDSILQMTIEDSPKVLFDNKPFPYQQTFQTIDKILNTHQPWLKFKLIGKLDRQIVGIFLQSRTSSQTNVLQDIISAEDAKTDIFAYVIQKYMNLYPHELEKNYYELRWMYDYDAVISPMLKNFTSPYFSRFLSIYEIAYNNKQQKKLLKQ